jgi:hypothetical protein
MRIMPSGNGAFDWLPKDGLTKVASTGEAVEEQDELLEAAKKVVAEFDSVEFETENFEVSDEVSDGEECPEVCEDDADVVDCLETAKDAIEGAIDCLEGGASDDEEVELEINIEDEVVEGGIGCLANDDEETVDGDDEEETVEASEEDEEEDEISVEASTDGWVKVSSISPKNRKKVYDYWSKNLGYPKDFVKLMVKDYEK